MCVCVILYFYPATCGPKGHGSGSAAALEQPAVAVYIYNRFLGTRPALPVIVGPPTARRKDKGKDKGNLHSRPRKKDGNAPRKKKKERYILGRAWAPLLSIRVLPRRDSPHSYAPDPRSPQELQHRPRGPDVPQESDRRGVRVLPLTRLPQVSRPRLSCPVTRPSGSAFLYIER